ncbi:YopX family protein [Virgibacillus halophilus]|uniref:YopX family protein n=1 Tax=Tigheibacillus halophilus TaxID=361280 RepID=A0ABU5C601_9BACI|nr:YopX family protein [Virgibacillus halophilus]
MRGDVVEAPYDGEGFTGVVVYDLSELDFKATNGQENYGSNFQYLTCADEIKIIGNVHENPELLRGDE